MSAASMAAVAHLQALRTFRLQVGSPASVALSACARWLSRLMEGVASTIAMTFNMAARLAASGAARSAAGACSTSTSTSVSKLNASQLWQSIHRFQIQVGLSCAPLTLGFPAWGHHKQKLQRTMSQIRWGFNAGWAAVPAADAGTPGPRAVAADAVRRL